MLQYLLKCLTIFAALNVAVRPAFAAPSIAREGFYVVRTKEFPSLRDEARGRAVPIKVHYPESGGSYPIIVFSHGGGGNWDANYAQAHHLASHGYVVLCLEHPASNTARMSAGMRFMKNLRTMTRDSAEVLGRPKDVSFAIDKAEEWNRSDPVLKGKLDTAHIGVAGHSFGAFTATVACGARPALNWLKPSVPPGTGLAPDLSDPRVDACVALSPQGPGEPFFLEESYKTIRKPILGITGTKDEGQIPAPEHRRKSYELMPQGDKWFLWITDVNHLAFSDTTGSGRRNLPSEYRTDGQRISRVATLLFFDRYLRPYEMTKHSLSKRTLDGFLGGTAKAVELLQK